MFKLVLEDTGAPHPASLSRPALRDDCVRYYDAFRILGVARTWSQVGPEPIKVSEVKALLDILEIKDVPTRLKYLSLIRSMDNVEMQFHADQAKHRAKK